MTKNTATNTDETPPNIATATSKKQNLLEVASSSASAKNPSSKPLESSEGYRKAEPPVKGERREIVS